SRRRTHGLEGRCPRRRGRQSGTEGARGRCARDRFEAGRLMSKATAVRPASEGHGTGLGDFDTEYMRINVGPQHPSTHGVLRLVVDLDGERIVSLRPHVGYLHTGFEKTMENRTYQQGVTYSNRMDYVNAFAHDLAYILGVEKLIDARVPERAQRVRVILTELNRIASHLVFFGTTLLDMGALTPFF